MSETIEETDSYDDESVDYDEEMSNADLARANTIQTVDNFTVNNMDSPMKFRDSLDGFGKESAQNTHGKNSPMIHDDNSYESSQRAPWTGRKSDRGRP